MKRLHSYTNTISFKYINDIFITIQRNLILAAEKNNPESFDKLLNFYRTNLLTKSFGKSPDIYSKASASTIAIYKNLNSQYRSFFLDSVFESQTMKISISGYSNQIDKHYIELTYLSLIHLSKQLLQDDNYTDFNRVFRNQRNSIFRIESKNNQDDYLFKFVTTLLCWIYYLQLNNKISYDKYELSFLENTFRELTVGYDYNFLNEFFSLFTELENGLWTAEDWEVSEPPSNQVYFALSASTWLKQGLLVLLLNFQHLLRINDDLTNIELNNRFRYLVGDFEKEFEFINLENKNLLKIIAPPTIDKEIFEQQFTSKKEQVLEVFNFLKKEVEIENYRKIQEVPLSQSKIEKFRNEVGQGWKDSTVIINVLNNFKQINYLPNIEKKDGYGFFQTLLKGKFAFIDGEFYKEIHGLSNFGSQLARNIDNQFFQKALEIKEPKLNSNINAQIDVFLDTLEDKSKVLIFANRQNEQKIESTALNEEKGILNSYKSYRDVPIINSYNKFKEYIFIIDFSKIKMEIFKSDSPLWYENQLLVDVTSYSKENITDQKIQEWSEKDKFNYNASEVDILESNNVNIKILLKFEFLFEEDSKFLIIDCR